MNVAIRAKAAGVHLGLSGLIGLLAAALVFGLWYPSPYRTISGGQSLFILIVSVDLVLGPALTFVVFDLQKSRSVLIRDLAVIAALQIGGLVYGLHTVYQARPVALVYEPGRFRVVTNVDVLDSELPQAPPELRNLSVTGPRLLGTRKPRDNDEQLRAIEMALRGADVGQRPSFWQPYPQSIASVIQEGRPLQQLYSQYPGSKREIEKYLMGIGRHAEEIKFLPIIAKESNWSALVDAKTGEIVGYVPYDGFTG